MMPEDLATTMTEQQLVDLISFLVTLKKEKPGEAVSALHP
jgi:hypothetical protein